MEPLELTNKWEHFSHDADVGIRGVGSSVKDAFEMAALALVAVVTDPEKVDPAETITVSCQDPDIELLFLDWINALIYEMDTRQMLFSRFNVHINEGHLSATVMGEKINSKKHDPAVDIKGATMTELKVVKTDTHWVAQCVVDV